jgi:hypothetical protein
MILVTGAVLATWTGSAAQEKADVTQGLKVTISVHSGRPDPFFYLDKEADIQRLRALLKNAAVVKTFDRDTVIPAILGYRGVEVMNGSGVRGVPGYLAVYKGTVEVRNKEKTFLVDKDGALEQYLLKLAIEKKAISSKLYERITAPAR